MIDQGKQPLQGKTILVTRSRSQASDLAVKIKELGGQVAELPVIKLVPPQDPKPMEHAIQHIRQFDWILFTSTNGVQFFFDAWKLIDPQFSHGEAKFGAVGPKTEAMLREYGQTAEVVAQDFKAEGLLDALKPNLSPGAKILLPRANIARAVLPQELRHLGMEVTEVVAYENVISEEGSQNVISALHNKKIDIITFTSSSTVKNFCEILKQEPLQELLMDVKIACIGPITAETAAGLGLQVDIVSEEWTIAGLVEALTHL